MSENKDALLAEYDKCDEKAGRIDALVWQFAAVMFPITLAGFTYFGLSTTHTVNQFFVVLAVAIGSITLLVTWSLLAHQWHGYQTIAYYRMREIEAELGLWHYRYSGYMSWTSKKRKFLLEEIKDEDEKARLLNVETRMKNFPLVGLSGTVNLITSMYIIGWVLLVIRELILIFFP